MTAKSKPATNLTVADLKLLKRYRIEPEFHHLIRRVTDEEARSLLNMGPSMDLAGLAFIGHDIWGRERGVASVRRDCKDGNPDPRYMCPPAEAGRYLFCLPGADQALQKPGVLVMLVEAVKSVFAVASWARRTGRNVVPIALGGCWGWKVRLSKDESVPIEDLVELAGLDVCILLDANVASNHQVKTAERSLGLHLSQTVKVGGIAGITSARIPPQEAVNGPDDFLEHHADSKMVAVVDGRRSLWLLSDKYTSYAQLVESKPPTFIINNNLQAPGITGLGGPSQHSKSWIALQQAKAVLTGLPLYGYREFTVPAPIVRVLYLAPELMRGQVKHRLELLHMMDLVQENLLLIRVLEDGPPLISDPDILMAARGAMVILDTAIRFMTGEENRAESNREGLWKRCAQLMSAEALVVLPLHHSHKGWEKDTELTLENVFRGTGDFGAMLSDAYGVRQLDKNTNLVHIEHLKPRDQDVRPPFQIQGRPFIDKEGTFRMVKEPGACGTLYEEQPKKERGGRKEDAQKDKKIEWLRSHIKQGAREGRKLSLRELARDLNSVEEFKGSNHDGKTIARWLSEDKREKKLAQQIIEEEG
jgi:hypothetical protein